MTFLEQGKEHLKVRKEALEKARINVAKARFAEQEATRKLARALRDELNAEEDWQDAKASFELEKTASLSRP